LYKIATYGVKLQFLEILTEHAVNNIKNRKKSF